MSNRLYSQFKDRKSTNDTNPPPTGKRGKKMALPKESTAKWAKPPGKVKPRDRSLGMPIVKCMVAGDYMKGNAGLEGVLFPPSLPSQASPRATQALLDASARVPTVRPTLPTLPVMPTLPLTANPLAGTRRRRI